MSSKYSVLRQGKMWIVRQGWSIVYYSDSHQDCIDWCAANG